MNEHLPPTVTVADFERVHPAGRVDCRTTVDADGHYIQTMTDANGAVITAYRVDDLGVRMSSCR